jgi:hypothetical protein
MSCQTDTAQKILDGGGDCVLALKGNPKNSLDSVRYLFDRELKNDFSGVFHTEALSVEKGHGRIEARKVYSIGGPEVEKWPGPQSLTMVESVREINGSSTSERRYCIGSLPANAKVIGGSVRSAGEWKIAFTG